MVLSLRACILEESHRSLARTIEELPPLKPEHTRAVHLTHNPHARQEIIAHGLKYPGLIQSTAVNWNDESLVVYNSDDPRFKDGTAYVFDVPFDEYMKHTRLRNPGILSSEYLVGVIDRG